MGTRQIDLPAQVHMLCNFVQTDEIYLWADQYTLLGYDHEFALPQVYL